MDVEKLIKHTQFKIFGKTLFEITTKLETNYNENVTPITPIVELNLNDMHNNN